MNANATVGTLERRRHARTHLQMNLPCIRLDPDGGDVADSLQMYDISRSGIGAYCNRPFYPGQRIVLCLPLTGETGRRNIYASIVRCRPELEGYRVGMEFEPSSLCAWTASTGLNAYAA